MTKLITLSAWAGAKYDPAPCAATLRNWTNDGKIIPPPVKVGKGYLVRPDAKHINEVAADSRLVGRIGRR